MPILMSSVRGVFPPAIPLNTVWLPETPTPSTAAAVVSNGPVMSIVQFGWFNRTP